MRIVVEPFRVYKAVWVYKILSCFAVSRRLYVFSPKFNVRVILSPFGLVAMAAG